MLAKQIHIGGVPEHFNLPWQLGLEEGLFAAAGLELVFSEYPTGTGAMCADLRAGKLDLAVALTEGLQMDIARHDQIRLIAPFVLSPLRWGIHVGAQAPFEQVADLADTSFAISRYGSGSHLMALLWAREQGWDPQAMKFIEVGGLDALEASVNDGRASAFLWEVFTTLPRVQQGNLRRLGEFPTPWPCFMIATQSAAASALQPEFDSLLQVLYGLTARCMQQPEMTIAEVSRRHQLSEADARSWFADVRWATEASLPVDTLEKTRQTLAELGLI